MVAYEGAHAGFALPAAVIALVAVGLIATGAFWISRQEAGATGSHERAVRALYLAERGIGDALATEDVTAFTRLPVLGDTVLRSKSAGGGWEVTVTRFDARTFFFDGTGRVSAGGENAGSGSDAVRRVGVVARASGPLLDLPAALVSVDPLRAGDEDRVSGRDVVPAGWDGVCDAEAARDGHGARSVASTPAAGVAVLPGSAGWRELVGAASVELPDGAVVERVAPDSTRVGPRWACAPGSTNWGEPRAAGSACFDHTPVIHAAGDLVIDSDGVGQGVLLVEGDLELRGGFEFVGPVVVGGRFGVSGTGGRVTGGVVATRADLSASAGSGGAVVRLSTCAASRPILKGLGGVRLRPLPRRGWVDLSRTSERARDVAPPPACALAGAMDSGYQMFMEFFRRTHPENALDNPEEIGVTWTGIFGELSALQAPSPHA